MLSKDVFFTLKAFNLSSLPLVFIAFLKVQFLHPLLLRLTIKYENTAIPDKCKVSRWFAFSINRFIHFSLPVCCFNKSCNFPNFFSSVTISLKLITNLKDNFINGSIIRTFSFHIIPSLYIQNRCYYIIMKILLKKKLKERNMSLRQLEIKSGISKSTLSRICRGEVSPTMKEMELLAKGLHIKITDLFDSPYN